MPQKPTTDSFVSLYTQPVRASLALSEELHCWYLQNM